VADLYTLQGKSDNGQPLQACFDPAQGMALVQLKQGDIEVLETSPEQSLVAINEEAGTIIGPHFGERIPQIVPELSYPEKWGHLEALRQQGAEDPFPDGIARYVAWQTDSASEKLSALLDGEQEVHGQELEQLEGQRFKMRCSAQLTDAGLQLSANVVSDADSIVGYSFAFRLPNGKGELTSDVADYHLDGTNKVPLPEGCRYDENHCIHLDLSQPTHYTFHPYTDPTSGQIDLRTEEYKLRLAYSCASQENAWQVIRPEGGFCVILRCLSAKYPCRPTLSVSGIKVQLQLDEG